MTTILVTFDGSDLSEAILPVLNRLGGNLIANMCLLTVMPPPHATAAPSRLTRRFAGWAGAGWMEVTDTGADRKPIDRGWLETEGQALERVLDEGRDLLTPYAEQLRRAGLEAALDVVIDENVAEAIIESARAHSADYIAMATHGRGGLSGLVQGSVAASVLRSGVAPMILVRPSS